MLAKRPLLGKAIAFYLVSLVTCLLKLDLAAENSSVDGIGPVPAAYLKIAVFFQTPQT
jgi:hypothetical protein